jgi:hypothetical protein
LSNPHPLTEVPSITARPNQSPSEPCRSLLPSRVDGRQAATSPSTSFRPAYAPPPTVGRQEFMGAVEYSRSGCPDLGVHTSRFEPMSYLLSPQGRRRFVRQLQGHSRQLGGSVKHRGSGSAEELGILQRNGQGCVGPLRGLEDPNIPLSAPTDVQSSLLHLQTSWKGNSAKFAVTEF